VASDVGNLVGELSCEIIHALDHGVGIDMELFGQLAPVMKAVGLMVFRLRFSN